MSAKCTAFIALMALAEVCFGQDDAVRPFGRPIDFFAEEVTLSVSESTASISGVYYFRNSSDRGGTFPILFPFYVDSLTLYPDHIRADVFDGADTTELEVRRLPERNAITLGIPIKPRGVTAWHLQYSQKILGTLAVYIITSTQTWGKPLEEATYRFIAPANFDSVTVWPEADSTREYDHHIEYISHKKDFMPDRDMAIRWK